MQNRSYIILSRITIASAISLWIFSTERRPLFKQVVITTMMVIPSLTDPFSLHWSLYPRQYVAPYISSPLVIDGNIEKPEWSDVPWSNPFDDIRGAEDAPPSERPRPTCRTRMKMLWDEKFLYVCALVESDFTVTANFTERNEPIYHTDSDFEVFLNPSGSCHNYKELEMNAINTVWNLMLDKPYDDGGAEHSGRIAKPGDEQYYEVYSQKSAAKVVQGRIGDPDGAKWAVEIALAHSDTLAHDPRGKLPEVGHRWRINFSRVENKGDTNWTWQAQRVWDPEIHRVVGKVAMHLPDSWGYVQFGPGKKDVNSETQILRDPTWPARLAAMNIYYAQRLYAKLHNGNYAPDIKGLGPFTDHRILDPFQNSSTGCSIHINLLDEGRRYMATVIIRDGSQIVSVTDDRLMSIDEVEVSNLK